MNTDKRNGSTLKTEVKNKNNSKKYITYSKIHSIIKNKQF